MAEPSTELLRIPDGLKPADGRFGSGPSRVRPEQGTLLRSTFAGTTIEEHLPVLGWPNVSSVRVGKAIRLTVEAESEDAARRQVDDMCRRFLANPVLEDWRVSVGD